MIPSSAAMPKGLQQNSMTSLSFSMENLLQSSESSDDSADISLTLNWTAIMAYQRPDHTVAETLARIQQQQQQQSNRLSNQRNLENNGKHSSTSKRSSSSSVSPPRTAHEMHPKKKSRMPPVENCDRVMYPSQEPVKELPEPAERSYPGDNLAERLSDKLENRTNSAMDSVDEDRNSGAELDSIPDDAPLPPGRPHFEYAKHQQQHPSHPHLQQQQQQHPQHIYSPAPQKDKDVMVPVVDSRMSEVTCSCGEEQCTGGAACRRIQEKEKPLLKFSVSAILGDNHERRPNIIGSISLGQYPENVHGLTSDALSAAYLLNLQNSQGYRIAKPIARVPAYHPQHPGGPPSSHHPPQHHSSPNALLPFLQCRSHYVTVTSPGGSQHLAGANPNSFPTASGPISTDMIPLLPFPWSGTARGKPRRGMMKRAVFSDMQRKGLESRFMRQKYITKPDRKKLADKLGLKDSQVKIWFQNRRMKWRNTKERELMQKGGSREQTLPTKNNQNPDLSDAIQDTHPVDLSEDMDCDEDEEINVVEISEPHFVPHQLSPPTTGMRRNA